MYTIAICGSATFLKEMDKLQQRLKFFGFEVYTPRDNDKNASENEAGYSAEAVRIKLHTNAIRNYERLIRNSDGVLIANLSKNGIDGYIGGNVLMEMGYAFAGNKDIFLLNPIPNISYRAEIEAMQPMILQGNLEKIKEYHDALPLVYLSSESAIKMRSVAHGLRELNKRVRVRGVKTASGVSEEPRSFDETFEGAKNRLENLRRAVSDQYDYLCSIEGGIAKLISGRGYYDVHVCIIEDAQGRQGHAVESSIEYPQDVIDLVPGTYADLGVWAQQVFGYKEKDPILPLTHGKIPRESLVRQMIVNAFAMLEG